MCGCNEKGYQWNLQSVLPRSGPQISSILRGGARPAFCGAGQPVFPRGGASIPAYNINSQIVAQYQCNKMQLITTCAIPLLRFLGKMSLLAACLFILGLGMDWEAVKGYPCSWREEKAGFLLLAYLIWRGRHFCCLPVH